MRIVQITDLHVRGEQEEIKGEEDTRANLFLIIQHLISLNYDLLTVTGDLCLDKPNNKIYQWIKEQFSSSLDYDKIRFISGNHDDTKMLQAVLCPEYKLLDDELYFQEKMDGTNFYFIDTSKGFAHENQKKWIKSEIEKSTQASIYIFMHHPPVIAGVKYMDTSYALKDMKDFQSIFKQFPDKSFHIFCGHYHSDRVISYDNVTVYITPSCYVQINPDATKFVAEHYDIGYRIIDISHQNKLITEVRYLL